MTDDDVMMARYRHEHLTHFQATHREDQRDALYSGTAYFDRVRELALVSASDVPVLLDEIERLQALLSQQEETTP